MSSQDRRTPARRTVFRAVSIIAVVIVVGIVATASYVFYDGSMHAEDKGAPSGPVTPALNNAVARLTGVRLREAPMTPERVKKALG